MVNRFYKLLDEMLSTTSAGVGSTNDETHVGSKDKDFFARGDARNPFGVKRKRKTKIRKRKKLK